MPYVRISMVENRANVLCLYPLIYQMSNSLSLLKPNGGLFGRQLQGPIKLVEVHASWPGHPRL